MKGRQIILGELAGREAAVLMVDGALDDLLVAGDAPAPGTVYRAVADRPVKGQGGLFLKTPDGMAYLRGARGIAPGRILLVQVTGYAEPGKAIPVTDRLLFKSRYAIVTPGAPGINLSRQVRDEEECDRLLEIAHDAMDGSAMGLIVRSAAERAPEGHIADDIAAMRSVAEQVTSDHGQAPELLLEGDGPHALAWRDWTGSAETIEGDFGALGVSEAVAEARGARVDLPGGASFWIEPTRALVAIDVNTGPDTSAAAGLKANIACARALPRALRVRGLGGQITLDPAPMPKKDRRAFETALRSAFRADEIETALAGWTPLGLFELQRKRARLPLGEILR